MAQAEAKDITAAGRRRLKQALDRFGMLPVQGQHEIPSIADLLEGAPIRTRGFSWDYVPTWETSEALAAESDKAMLKLFKGANTLVTAKYWPAVHVLARSNMKQALAEQNGAVHLDFLSLLIENPGLSGHEIKLELGLEGKAGGRTFQRSKALLERLAVIWGAEQAAPESHTHDQLWYPWDYGKVAEALKSADNLPSISDAAGALLAAVRPDGDISSGQKRKLFPILKFVA